LWDFLNCLRDYQLVFDCDLRSVSAVRASDRFSFFLLVELSRLISLYVDDAFIVAGGLGAYWLALCYPLFGRSGDPDSFGVINVLLGGLDNLVSNGFLHKVHLTLSYYLHELVLQRNDQFLIPLIFGCILIATSQSLQSSCASTLRNQGTLACLD
jgi:hypothetical protein